MSIENQLAALTAAVIELTAAVKSKGNVIAAPVAPTPALVAAPVAPVMPAPTPAPAPAPAPAPVAAPAMPAPPTFAPVAAPAPVTANTSAPFTDGKGLIDYVMGAYKAMGPQKGAQIQNILTGLGYQNINDVKPEHYGALHQGIEALKAA